MKDTIFTGVREKWIPLYAQLRNMTIEALGPFDEYATSGAVLWKHSTAFAEVSAKKDCIIVAFTSDVLHEEWGASKTLQTSKNRIVHYFEAADNTLFPEFVERIKQAYELTKPDHPHKKAEKLPKYTTVDEYIALYPIGIQAILKQMRKTIHEAAPNATEKISYQMPTFYQTENLVHFAALKNHIGFYPTPSGIEAFADKTTAYRSTKGALQFPLSEPIPYDLVAEITRFRVKEVMEKERKC